LGWRLIRINVKLAIAAKAVGKVKTPSGAFAASYGMQVLILQAIERERCRRPFNGVQGLPVGDGLPPEVRLILRCLRNRETMTGK
jgi:hypothetical protein